MQGIIIINVDIFYLLFAVPVEATAFLAAVSAFAVFLLVIFIYVNKKWRILNVGFGGNGVASCKGGRPHPNTNQSALPPQPTDIQNDKLDRTLQFASPLCTPGNCYSLGYYCPWLQIIFWSTNFQRLLYAGIILNY